MTREEEREEAIKTIQEFYYPILSRFWFDEKKDVLADALEMAIEALKKRPHGEWILCSERLPEVGGRYIVTEKRFAIDDRKHNGRYQTIVEEVNFSNNKWDRANFFEIVAWMPLPEPYKKEGDEK